jgi:hypothetical protein
MNRSAGYQNSKEILFVEQLKERKRIIYFLLIVIVVTLGLGSRHYSKQLPGWVELYAGDTLWALNVFLMLGFIFKWKSSLWIAIVALSFSFLIEISQLYHAPWIDGIRAYKLGGVILGFGFLWSDLVCYVLGILAGYIFEELLFMEKKKI